MKIIGENLVSYDSDQKIPIYGFGGIPQGSSYNKVSHCFALNGDIGNPEVEGAQGLLDCYKHAIDKVKLHGPTFFNELLS